jgi:hypothetical protein
MEYLKNLYEKSSMVLLKGTKTTILGKFLKDQEGFGSTCGQVR